MSNKQETKQSKCKIKKEMKKNTNVKCPKCGHAFMTSGYVRKLTIDDVEFAKKMKADGYSYRNIARYFNVHHSSIHSRINDLRRIRS